MAGYRLLIAGGIYDSHYFEERIQPKIQAAGDRVTYLGLLERLVAADVNQMPVVSHSDDGAAHIVGLVTRDAILRVIQTRSELGAALGSR